jgi:LacI family transcriptional regulator
MAPSLKDVARLAGVNASTASRAIRGDPTQRINVETRARVLAAADALGYRANYLGRGLRVRRTGTIGVVVPNLDFFTFVDVTHGVQAAAIEHDRSLLLVEVDQFAAAAGDLPTDELIYRRLVAEGRVDGLVIGSRTLADPLVRQLAERRFPMVMVNRRVEGIPAVVGRDEDACRLAVATLAAHGHRRVGMIGVVVEGEDVGERRDRAFSEAVTMHRLDPDPDLIVRSLLDEEQGRQAVHWLFAQTAHDPPTGLFIATFSVALWVLQGLRELEVSVPDGLSVITFPEHRIAQHTNPPLTTVTSSMFQMGQEAGRLLMDIIDGQEVESVQLDDLPRVVDRGSVGPPPARAGAIAPRDRSEDPRRPATR